MNGEIDWKVALSDFMDTYTPNETIVDYCRLQLRRFNANKNNPDINVSAETRALFYATTAVELKQQLINQGVNVAIDPLNLTAEELLDFEAAKYKCTAKEVTVV